MTEISDKLTIQEEVEIWRRGYENNVKRLINSGEYTAASFELGSINDAMSQRRLEIINKIHSGGSYMGLAKLLEKKLQNANSIEDIKNTMEGFEAYQAQTKLPRID